MRQKLLKILALILVSHVSYCQTKKDSLERLFGEWYDGVVGVQANELMYNSIYLTALRGRTTHQYFDRKDWQSGSLVFSMELYNNVPMLFDIEREELIVRHPDPYRWDGVVVNMDSLRSFNLTGHEFRKYSFANGKGFYNVLFEGKNLLLLAKRRKKSKPQKEGIELERLTDYFIIKDNLLIPMKGIKTLIQSYPNFKSTIQEIKKMDHLRIKIRKEETIIEFMKLLDDKMEVVQ